MTSGAVEARWSITRRVSSDAEPRGSQRGGGDVREEGGDEEAASRRRHGRGGGAEEEAARRRQLGGGGADAVLLRTGHALDVLPVVVLWLIVWVRARCAHAHPPRSACR